MATAAPESRVSQAASSERKTNGDRLADEKEARRRRREIFLILLLPFLLLGLTFFEFSLGRFRTGLPFNDNILFFAIINLNIILILLLLFLILRNLVKLIFERRRRVLGATLRTKLVAAFVLLSLVPTGILFYVSWSFISRSIEMWVHVQVERSLEGALSVSRAYYKSRAEDTLYFAKQIAQAIEREGLLGLARHEKLGEFLRLQQITFRLKDVLLVDPGEGRTLRVESDGSVTPGRLEDPDGFFAGWEGEEVTRIRERESGEVVEAIVAVGPMARAGGKSWALVVQNDVPESLMEKMVQISESLERHKQMMLYKAPFKSVIFMALIMVTLLIVFAASWFGFFLAKGMTIPIQRLAGGIRDVAAGNLSTRIETASEDEMGILVDSFNRMVLDLRKKGDEIEEAQDHLHQTNVELEQRRRYMEILLRNIGAGVISLDRDGRIQTMNRSMEELFGIQGARFVGRPYGDLFSLDAMQPIRELIEESVRKRSRSLERQVTVPLRQEPRSLRVRTSMLEDEGGAWMGVVMVFEDHSELIRAQRVAAWREVARRIAHEIKNPLTPIQLSAQRLQKRYRDRFREDGKVFEECTNTIIRQVEEMKNLVNEFSQFARMPAANPVPTDLNKIVREVVSLYRQAHRHQRFHLEEEPQLPRLNLDPDQIRRVIVNLMDNAVAASPDAGEVSIRTRYEALLGVGILDVADQGNGIPRHMRDRIFEPYTTTKKGGTGLGLTIVKTIVADHNGYIRVRDNEPRGTRFSLEFPVPR